MNVAQRAAALRRTLSILLCLGATAACPARAADASLSKLACGKARGEVIAIRGKVDEPEHLSGAAVVGDLLLVVSDEAKRPTAVEVLKKDRGSYKVSGKVQLPGGDDEVDLEAVAVDRRTVYVTGSHASTRRIKNGRIEAPKRKESREQFFRFRLEADGTARAVEGPKSLSPAIEASPVLRGFVGLASKENGIDIEGLAVKDGRLYFGFRGPVLRGGLVPVLSTTWEDPATVEVRYVSLDGRGIRDLAAVEGGFLVLAGPVGDGDASYRIYFWDGADQLSDAEDGPRPQRVAELASTGPGKPEGLAVLDAHGRTYDLVLVCDGLPEGGLTRSRLTRP